MMKRRLTVINGSKKRNSDGMAEDDDHIELGLDGRFFTWGEDIPFQQVRP